MMQPRAFGHLNKPVLGNVFPIGLPVFARYEARNDNIIPVANNGRMTTINDLSGIAGNGLQPIALNQPTMHRGATPADDYVNFAAVAGNFVWFIIPSLAVISTCIEGIFICQTSDTTGQTGLHITGTDGQSNHLPYSDTHYYDSFGSNSRKDSGAISLVTYPSSVWHILHFKSKNGLYSIKYNNVVIYTTASNTFAVTTTPLWGQSVVGYNGQCKAAYYFNGELTTQQITDLYAFFHSVYGI